jgi:hypothetical protein
MTPSPALIEMMLADSGGEPEPPRIFTDPAPPIEPLLPVAIPPPDWRAEESERAARDAGELELEPANSLQRLPAPKRKASKTPNLDELRGKP